MFFGPYSMSKHAIEAYSDSLAIQELVELNQDHAFSYDRDTLIEMLDEALATTEQ